ncbi:MAG: WhiB family transcriptional regulator [Pseudonocardia sp.]|nr:WhiB family transcriptional regulator [Pseudonocardia sp.]
MRGRAAAGAGSADAEHPVTRLRGTTRPVGEPHHHAGPAIDPLPAHLADLLGPALPVRAACAGREPLWDLDVAGEDPDERRYRHRRAQAVCARCPALDACRAVATHPGRGAHRVEGIWGGEVLHTPRHQQHAEHEHEHEQPNQPEQPMTTTNTTRPHAVTLTLRHHRQPATQSHTVRFDDQPRGSDQQKQGVTQRENYQQVDLGGRRGKRGSRSLSLARAEAVRAAPGGR